ncbi:glycosyltransferase family 9 protein [Mucilaginibacter antarcticus]|uniref:Glycosyltransferase family 9 protein n=1 Tax=Mucilaginibacter antarcticus TaxID=1855725 RepID=A0ABW5XJJ6_9SPHI
MAQNRNMFRLTRFTLLKLPWLFRFFAKFRQSQKRLLIIKTDAIGDYILFRNFIEEVKTSVQYCDYKMDILGNPLWKDLAAQYDAPFVNQFIFTKAESLYDKPLDTLKLAWQLFSNNYGVVLQPSYSRTLINDGLAGLTAAKQIIGFASDTERMLPKYKGKTDSFYTKLLPLPQQIYFEFDRTKFFFESVLAQSLALNGPSIGDFGADKKGIVIFPGAGIIKRTWEADKFLALIKLIREQTGDTIYLAGGPGEVVIGDFIAQNLPAGAITNLINKTTLPGLVDLIGKASLIISNETSAIHIAAATKTNCVCILGGGHFERFAPYPSHIINRPVCVYEKMPCYYCNWQCIFKTLPTEPHPCVDIVTLADVWQATLPLLPVAQ